MPKGLVCALQEQITAQEARPRAGLWTEAGRCGEAGYLLGGWGWLSFGPALVEFAQVFVVKG